MAVTRKKIRALLDREFVSRGDFVLSSGASSDIYVDCRAAILKYQRTFRKFLDRELGDLEWPEPVATGAGGALLLATFGSGYLWNPKGHGLEWSPTPKPGTRVALLDDVKTSGGTLDRLREACVSAGLKVVGEVVLYDRSDPRYVPAIYLASPYSSPIPGVAEARFNEAMAVVAGLQAGGHMVYSPILHSHPVAMKHDLPTDFNYWQHLNRVFIAKLDEVWVIDIPGWRESVGVRGEIEYAQQIGKPVWILDRATLKRERLPR